MKTSNRLHSLWSCLRSSTSISLAICSQNSEGASGGLLRGHDDINKILSDYLPLLKREWTIMQIRRGQSTNSRGDIGRCSSYSHINNFQLRIHAAEMHYKVLWPLWGAGKNWQGGPNKARNQRRVSCPTVQKASGWLHATLQWISHELRMAGKRTWASHQPKDGEEKNQAVSQVPSVMWIG